MGLDMYLYRSISIFPNKKNKDKITLEDFLRTKDNDCPSDLKDDSIIIDLEKISSIEFEVGYWRKSNHIHKWFVDNVQNGLDNCNKYDVLPYQLEELLSICKEIKNDHSKADELLPTQEGFFFGSTDYDQGYYDDIEDTIQILESVINDKDFHTYDYHYRSSW